MFECKLMCLNLTISVDFWLSYRYVFCNSSDRGKQDAILVETLFIFQTFLFKCNMYQLCAK